MGLRSANGLFARSFILIISGVLAYAGEANADRGASDEYCRKFYANLVKGPTSNTYIWTPTSSRITVKSASTNAPPLDTPEVVSLYRPKPIERDAPDTRTMSATEFDQLYPHDINDLTRSQTSANVFGSPWMVEKYDPVTREVTLYTENVKTEQGSARIIERSLGENILVDKLMKESTPSVQIWGTSYYVDRELSTPRKLSLFRWKGSSDARYKDIKEVPIKISDSLYISGVDLPLDAMKPGGLINEAGGVSREVRSVGEHGQGKVFWRRGLRHVVPLGDFLDEMATAEAKNTSPPAVAPNQVRTIFSKLNEFLSPRKKIELVGKNGFTRTKKSVSSLEDFSFSKTEIDARAILTDIFKEKYPKGTRFEWKTIDEQKVQVFTGEPYDDVKYMARQFLESPYETSNMYKLEEVKILKPGDKEAKVIRQEYIRKASGNMEIKFYDVTPVEGVELQYSVNGSKGKNPVTVRFPRTNMINDARLERIADQLIANLPREHADAQGVILLETGEYYLKDAAGLAFSRTSDGEKVRAISMMGNQLKMKSPMSERIHVFWHETGHSIAEKLWQNNRVPSIEWTRAMSIDGKHVSGYAMKNLQEDFAETVAAYISTDAGRLQPELRANFKARFAMLDRIFAVPAEAALLQSTIRTNQVRLGIGVTTVSLGGAAAVYYYSTTH